MLNLNSDSVEVSVDTGDVLSFGSSKDNKGNIIYTVIYNKLIKSPESLSVRNEWNSWHNYGVRTDGYDVDTLAIFGDTIDFNRYFMYAPYGGVSISTFPNKDARFAIKLVADDKSQFDILLGTFDEWNGIDNKFNLFLSGNSSFGPYLIYKAK